MNPTLNFTIIAHMSSIYMCQMHLDLEHREVIGNMSMYTISDFCNPGCDMQQVVPRYIPRGHGGGNAGLMRAWLKAVREKEGMEWAPTDQPGWDDFYPEEGGRSNLGRGSMVTLGTRAMSKTNFECF